MNLPRMLQAKASDAHAQTHTREEFAQLQMEVIELRAEQRVVALKVSECAGAGACALNVARARGREMSRVRVRVGVKCGACGWVLMWCMWVGVICVHVGGC